jgi:DNA-binding HxlR family transcriptional regulator
MKITTRLHHGDCQSVSRVLARIGDKWSVLVIMMLSERPLRFNELRRIIDGISQRMLTLTLRGLERDGIVMRHLTPIIPPRVDYQLTDLGRSLCEPVIALGAWARQHGAEIERAQMLFDRAQGAKPPLVAKPLTIAKPSPAAKPSPVASTRRSQPLRIPDSG